MLEDRCRVVDVHNDARGSRGRLFDYDFKDLRPQLSIHASSIVRRQKEHEPHTIHTRSEAGTEAIRQVWITPQVWTSPPLLTTPPLPSASRGRLQARKTRTKHEAKREQIWTSPPLLTTLALTADGRETASRGRPQANVSNENSHR